MSVGGEKKSQGRGEKLENRKWLDTAEGGRERKKKGERK